MSGMIDLDAIQARANAATEWPVKNIADVDRSDLLALVREQAAQIERVETLAEEHARVGRRVTPEDIRAALTATEGAA